MFQSTEGFYRTRRVVACGTAALFLAIGCLPPGRSQQAVPGVPAGSAPSLLPLSPRQIMAFIKSPTDITPIRDGIRDGTLFHAIAPLSEKALRQKDGTPAEVSFTVPLTVDRVHNRLSIQALINDRKIRLILDTGAMPIASLNQMAAHGIELTDKVPLQQVGTQGYEPATLGLAKSLTLGNLTLQQIPTSVSRSNPFYGCTLGLSAFERYRVTLDFAANMMTLTRGGAPVPFPKGGASLTVPFEDENGYLFVPVHIPTKDGWAFLDSGADVTLLSFEAATAAAAQLPASDTKTVVSAQKIGVGDTARKFKIIELKSPVPISMNTSQNDAIFNTTSQFGMSDIDDVLDSSFSTHTHIIAQLGFPFLVQFQRVILDYPSHTLILQYPANNTYVKVPSSPTGHDKPWPGYKWRQKGYAWIEVPDGNSASVPVSPVTYPRGTVVINMPATTSTPTMSTPVTSTAMRVIVVAPAKDGNITVTVDGVRSIYSFPIGSTVKVEKDGLVHILPPGSVVRDENDGSISVTPGVPGK